MEVVGCCLRTTERSGVRKLKNTNCIRQYGGYMFRPFIGSSSGFFFESSQRMRVHVVVPTMLTNSITYSRNVKCVTIELRKIDVIVYK